MTSLGQAPLDAQGGHDGSARVILVGERGAEQRHETVAQKLVDRPFVAMDLSQRQLEEPVQEAVHRLGSEPLGQRCGAGQVAKEDGDLLALAFQGTLGREDLLGEMPGSVGVRGRETWPGEFTERGCALPTELVLRGIRHTARRAGRRERCRALAAESYARGVLRVAPGTLHSLASDGSGRSARTWLRERSPVEQTGQGDWESPQDARRPRGPALSLR